METRDNEIKNKKTRNKMKKGNGKAWKQQQKKKGCGDKGVKLCFMIPFVVYVIQQNVFHNIPRMHAGQTIAFRKHGESTRITKSPKSLINGQDFFKHMFDSFAFA